MSDSIFYKKIVHYKEMVMPNELVDDIDYVLTTKIKHKIGNKCSKEGFIKKDSIHLLERSIGKINSAHFSGNIEYNIQFEVETCNPLEGNIIEQCNVIGKNKMGVFCKKGPMLIALSKIHHQDNVDDFDRINIGDIIDIEVICSKFELNDTEIHVIGKMV
jgi:DNA-directed RNA polymerase subunit E'/Rpb7